MLVTCVIGAGIGFTYGSMPALIMGAVPASETGAANSLNTLMRSIGTSTASAVAGVILAQRTTDLGTTPLLSRDGFKVVLAVGAGAALLAFAVASFIPRQRGAEAGAAAAGVGTASGGEEPVAGTPVETDSVGGGGRLPSRGLGRVLRADRTAVGGAAVTLISPRGKQLGRTVSRDDGSYGLDTPGAGSYVLIAASEGCQPQASTIVVAAEPVTYDVLLSGTSGLAGAVRSADGGTPVAEAVVIVTDARGEVLATGRTDVLGEFAVTDLVPGPVTLAVSSPKHRPLAQVVEIGGAGITRVALDPAARRAGAGHGARRGRTAERRAGDAGGRGGERGRRLRWGAGEHGRRLGWAPVWVGRPARPHTPPPPAA